MLINLYFASIPTKNLKKQQILKILNLKDTHWNFGITSQKSWFDKNVKKNDIHNILYNNYNQIIGYTLLRNKKILYLNKKKNFLLFDTLIVNRKLRMSGIGSMLMDFNNLVIKKKKTNAVLVCEKKLVSFYKKFGWVLLKKNKITFPYKNRNKNILFFRA